MRVFLLSSTIILTQEHKSYLLSSTIILTQEHKSYLLSSTIILTQEHNIVFLGKSPAEGIIDIPTCFCTLKPLFLVLTASRVLLSSTIIFNYSTSVAFVS
jgi:hypothetical protein